jgi:TPR repeat protein
MYTSADGVHKNIAKAVELFNRACNATSVSACFNVAGIFRNGNGVPQDISNTFDFYRKSCDLNLQSACEQYSIKKNGNVQRID